MSKKAQLFYALVRQIPKGKVTTYGILARQMSMKGARAIGNWLHSNPDAPATPCHRVVDRNGNLAKHFGSPGGIKTQAKRLSSEGVIVIKNHVDLSRYLWTPVK